MSDQYALHADRYAWALGDRVSEQLGELLSDLRRPQDARTVLETGGARLIADGLAETFNGAAMSAESELEALNRARGRRAFVASGVREAVSDFYATYLPPLVGQWTARALAAVNAVIEQGEVEGKSTRAISADLARDFVMPTGRAQNIVRTEGTRAVSLARRAVAARSIREARGPDWFIFKSLPDERRTMTCAASHNRRWRVERDRLEWWPPLHYYCRSGVVFGWDGMPGLDELPVMDELAAYRVREVQRTEFPDWDPLRLVGPLGTVNQVISTGAMAPLSPVGRGRLETLRERIRSRQAVRERSGDEVAELDRRFRERALAETEQRMALMIRERLRKKLR